MEVQDAWHCSWLSSSEKINTLSRMLLSPGEPNEMVLLCEHGMYSLQQLSCWKYNLIPPSLQSWQSSEWARTIETCFLTGLKKNLLKKCFRVLWLFNSCYSSMWDFLYTSPSIQAFFYFRVCIASTFCFSWKIKLSVFSELSEICLLQVQ